MIVPVKGFYQKRKMDKIPRTNKCQSCKQEFDQESLEIHIATFHQNECTLRLFTTISTRPKHHNVGNRVHSITIRKTAILQVVSFKQNVKFQRGLYRKIMF